MNDNIHNEISKIKEKLAKCDMESHKQDHDKLIKIEEKVNTITGEIKKLNDTQTDITDKLNETAGSLNLISDKVVQIVSKDTRKTSFWYTVIGGILITLLGGLIVYMVNSTLKNIQNTNDRNDKDIIDSRVEFIINKKINNEADYGKRK